MLQVPTVFLIALVVIVYAVISHFLNWWFRIVNKMGEGATGLWVVSAMVYGAITAVTITILSNLIVPTP